MMLMENTSDKIINKVANSGLITFDLEEHHADGERLMIDIKDQLYEGLILKERDFREFIKSTDWSTYRNKYVALSCSADAIVPIWAYMLLAVALQPFAKEVVFGSLDDLERVIFSKYFDGFDWLQFKDSKVVIKGCSKVNIPTAVYVDVTARIKPYASSIMFGEPCSTVPLFKKPKI
ncbi:MAG: DUF2480 family protein [Chryseolinea sp.]